MTRFRYYTSTTLDGYLADDEDSLDWLFRQHLDDSANTAAFLAEVGVQVMGSSTYLWVLEHERDWLPEIPTFVFTHRDLEPVNDHVRFVAGVPADHRAKFEAAAGGRDVWVMGGGGLVSEFAATSMLDEVFVSIAPVALGSGKPLFGSGLDLALQECIRNGDFVMARYNVVGPLKGA